jgi:GT2 family glycosyltransferase
MKASFIIVNFNSFDFIKRLLASKHKEISGLNDEIIIVDNNSEPERLDTLAKMYNNVKIFKMRNNIGFSKANNFAVDKSETEYLIFVNPDVLFTEDCITPIIKFMEKNSHVGACAPALLNSNMTIQYSWGFKMGLLYEIAEAFFFIGLLRKLYNFRFRSFKKTIKPFEVGWVSAALLVIKKAVFNDIGGFDPDFFLNYEDIDLCKRLKEKGYYNYYFPAKKSIHYSHQSIKLNYELLVTSRYLSRKLYAKKHYNVFVMCLVSLIHVIGIFLRLLTVYFFYKGDEKKQRRNGYKLSLKLYLSKI